MERQISELQAQLDDAKARVAEVAEAAEQSAYIAPESGYIYINGANTGLRACNPDIEDCSKGDRVWIGDDGYLYINGNKIADITGSAGTKVEYKDNCLYVGGSKTICNANGGNGDATTSNPATGIDYAVTIGGVVLALSLGTYIVLRKKYLNRV